MGNVNKAPVAFHLRLELTEPDGVTYLAGCTDPEYEDSSCPDKGDFAGMDPAASSFSISTESVQTKLGQASYTAMEPRMNGLRARIPAIQSRPLRPAGARQLLEQWRSLMLPSLQISCHCQTCWGQVSLGWTYQHMSRNTRLPSPAPHLPRPFIAAALSRPYYRL